MKTICKNCLFDQKNSVKLVIFVLKSQKWIYDDAFFTYAFHMFFIEEDRLQFLNMIKNKMHTKCGI